MINIKKKKLTPGFISILHTYGRSICWNPHIHMILLEGGITQNRFLPVNFFAYAAFRQRFRKILLDLLDKEINTNEPLRGKPRGILYALLE